MSTAQLLPRSGSVAFYLAAVAGAVAVGAAAAVAPVLAVVAVVVIAAFGIAVARIGFAGSVVVGSLLVLSIAGYAALYAPAVASTTQIAVGALIVMGIGFAPKVQISRSMKLLGGVFLGLCTLLAVPSFLISSEYAARGWIGLVASTFAVLAMAGVTSPQRDLPAEKLERIRHWTLGVIAFTVLINAALGFRQAVTGLNPRELAAAIASGSTFEVGDRARLMGAFATNQDFSLFAACVAPALLALSLTWRGRARPWFVVLTVLLYALTFLSLFRTALIASVVVGVIVVQLCAKGDAIVRFYKTIAVVAFAGIGAYCAILLINNDAITAATQRAGTLLHLGQDTSYNARVSGTLPRAFALLREFPQGLGAGAAGPVSAQFQNVAPRGKVTADNGYLMIAIQVGLLGLIALLGLLMSTVRFLRTKATPYAFAGIAGILAFLVAMLTASLWSLLAPGALVGALVGLGISAPPISRTEPEVDEETSPALSSRSVPSQRVRSSSSIRSSSGSRSVRA